MSRRMSAAAAMTCLAAAATGCSRGYASLSPAQVCASDQTLGRIKHAVFEQAATQASSQTRYALERLSQDVQATLHRPLVESYDHDTRKTACTADLDMWLPVGVAGARELQSAIHYDSQPTADGRDVVFDVSGLEQIASGVAGADLSAWAQAHAPRKPGLVVEVVPRSAGTAALAEAPRPARPARPPLLHATPAMSATRVAVASPTPPRSSPPDTSGDPSSLAAQARGPVAEGPVRVFVHISAPSALPAADHVRAELANLSLAGAPVATPPVRIVADTPRRTEVRCLKHADCPAAHRVAAYLAGRLGVSVAVVDMSSTYEDDAGVRPGSLELWLSRQDVASAL